MGSVHPKWLKAKVKDGNSKAKNNYNLKTVFKIDLRGFTPE